jgi:hypothetical protein
LLVVFIRHERGGRANLLMRPSEAQLLSVDMTQERKVS